MTGNRRGRRCKPLLHLCGGAIAALAAGVFWSQAGLAALTEDAQATAGGLGPVRIGMTVAQAEKAIGAPITYDPSAGGGRDCRYAWPSAGMKQVRFIIARGIILRIDIDDFAITTDKGARIGDSEARIKTLYAGDVVENPDPYIPGGHDFIVPSADNKTAILFETDGEVVLGYRMGDRKAVGWSSGCQ